MKLPPLPPPPLTLSLLLGVLALADWTREEQKDGVESVPYTHGSVYSPACFTALTRSLRRLRRRYNNKI